MIEFSSVLHLDIEMGRLVTGADNPVVLYVSGGNTQVTASLDWILLLYPLKVISIKLVTVMYSNIQAVSCFNVDA